MIMKRLLLFVIRLYWKLVPEGSRRPCLFRESCSRYVYRRASEQGLLSGLAAFRHRWQNCRGGYHVFEHPVSGAKKMVLPGGGVIGEDEMALRLLDEIKLGTR